MKAVEPVVVTFGHATSPAASLSREKNRMIVSIMMGQANVTLARRGHIFLNEVFDMLTLPRTREGVLLGWIYPAEVGSDHIEFGEELYQDGPPELTLSINVQGQIHDKI